MLKKIHNFGTWAFSDPRRAAAIGFLWFVPGSWLYSLCVRPHKFLTNLVEEVLSSIAFGIFLALLFYIMAKRKQKS